MAKQELPVDFKDDVLQAEMAGKRKYRIIQNEDGTISLEDVTNYSQIGSNFGAAQMNATNMAVNESFDKNKVIDSLDDIAANEQAGYAAGALAVRELNGKTDLKIIEKHIDTGYLKSGVHFYKRNSFGQIHFSSLQGWSLPYGTTKLCDFPDGYRPALQKKGVLYFGAEAVGFVEIRTDGLFATSIKELNSQTSYLNCGISYWIE